MAGIDISKNCLRWAAKREHRVEFAVASAYALPFADSAADLLLNCFSPLALAEFRRVLKPGGAFLYVVPGARHLWELKQILYEKPYLNEEQPSPYEGFRYLDILNVEGAASLPSQEVIHDLFAMTPYFWKTPKADGSAWLPFPSSTLPRRFAFTSFKKRGRKICLHPRFSLCLRRVAFLRGTSRFIGKRFPVIPLPLALRIGRVEHVADPGQQHDNALHAVRNHEIPAFHGAVFVLRHEVCRDQRS